MGNLTWQSQGRCEENGHYWAQTLGQAYSFKKVIAFNPVATLLGRNC